VTVLPKEPVPPVTRTREPMRESVLMVMVVVLSEVVNGWGSVSDTGAAERMQIVLRQLGDVAEVPVAVL